MIKGGFPCLQHGCRPIRVGLRGIENYIVVLVGGSAFIIPRGSPVPALILPTSSRIRGDLCAAEAVVSLSCEQAECLFVVLEEGVDAPYYLIQIYARNKLCLHLVC